MAAYTNDNTAESVEVDATTCESTMLGSVDRGRSIAIFWRTKTTRVEIEHKPVA